MYKDFKEARAGEAGGRGDSVDLMLRIGLDTVEEILRSVGRTLDRQIARIANPNRATN